MNPNRGELYQIDIEEFEHKGHELYGPHAYVIVSITRIHGPLKLVVAVPLTSPLNKETGKRKDEGDFEKFRKKIPESAKARVAGISPICVGESIALTEQVRVISVDRLKNPPFATLSNAAMASIELGLAYIQGLPPPSTRIPVPLAQKLASRLTLPEPEKKPVPGLPPPKE